MTKSFMVITFLLMLSLLQASSVMMGTSVVSDTSARLYAVYLSLDGVQSTSSIKISHTAASGSFSPTLIELSFATISIRDSLTNSLVEYEHQDGHDEIPITNRGLSTTLHLIKPLQHPSIVINIAIHFNAAPTSTNIFPVITSIALEEGTIVRFENTLTLSQFSPFSHFLTSATRAELKGDTYTYIQPQVLMSNYAVPHDLEFSYIRVTPIGRYSYSLSSPSQSKCVVNNVDINVELDFSSPELPSLLIPVDSTTRSNFITNGTLAITCNDDLSLVPTGNFQPTEFSTNVGDTFYLSFSLLNQHKKNLNYITTVPLITRIDYHQPVMVVFGFVDPTSALCQITISYDGYDRFTEKDSLALLFPAFKDLKGKSSIPLTITITDASDVPLVRFTEDIKWYDIPISDENTMGYRGYATPLSAIRIDSETLGDQTLLDVQFNVDLTQITLHDHVNTQCSLVYWHSNHRIKQPEPLLTGAYYFSTGSPFSMPTMVKHQ